jgi:diaminohydroxyphosphoribosylaminopyrimidine deaminase / 5-amino-6-(5-phosphoribosylamino)uracil reductase
MSATRKSTVKTLADEAFMRLAIREAKRGFGRTSPNPMVGAVIVKNGRILAKGWHRMAGKPHAEIEAIRALKNLRDAKGATIYITLEPCCTHGRTPPCTDAIIAAGFSCVVFGATDPNPAHAGRAVAILQKAGIATKHGILSAECAALNEAFNHWVTTGYPLVIAKAGLSLDGRFTRQPVEGQWLTSEASRRDAMRLRAGVDAILIGAETLRADNPRLTLRGTRGRQPLRVVLTRSGKLPKEAHLFTDEHRDRTLVYRSKTLRAVLRDLAKRGCTSVLIEGGGKLLGDAFDARLVNRAVFYFAPLLCGGPTVFAGKGAASSSAAPRIINPKFRRVGPDIVIQGGVL